MFNHEQNTVDNVIDVLLFLIIIVNELIIALDLKIISKFHIFFIYFFMFIQQIPFIGHLYF